MVKLFIKDTGAFLGTIDEADLQLLIDQLEEEDEQDTDYFINIETIDILEENGASLNLVNILNNAVGTTDGVEIAWEK